MAAKSYKLVFADGKTPLPTELRFLDAEGKIELQAAADKPKTFSGVAYSGGPLNVAGFPHPIYVDLRGLRIVRQDNAVLRSHKQEWAVGHTSLVAIAGNTLRFEGVVSCTGPHVDEVVGRVGFPWQPSIGTTIEANEKVEAGESASVNGRSVTGPAYIARKTTLREISFVEVGGDADATITLAAEGIIQAFNENHGPDGRFTDGEGGGGSRGHDSPKASMSSKASQYSKEASTASASTVTKGLTSKEDDASKSAAKATAAATSSGSKAAHEAAAQEHEKAGRLHQSASDHWSGSSAQAAPQLQAQHSEAAARHRGAAIFHRAAAGLAASSRQLSGVHQMEPKFETWAAERGTDLAKLTAPQRTMLQASFDAEVAKLGGVQHTNSVAELTAAMAAMKGELRDEFRLQSVLQARFGNSPETMAKAIAEKWDAGRIEAESKVLELRASRVTGAFIGNDSPDLTPKVLEAALCQTAKLPDADLVKAFDTKTLDLAHKNFRRMGVQGLLLNAAAANGYAVRIGTDQVRSDTRGLLEAAFGKGRGIQAAFSTNAISDILSNVANKFLLAGYSAVDQAWRTFSRVKPVKDFKTNTSYRLTGPGTWEQIGPSGEIKYGTLGDQLFTNQALTYAKMVSITRTDIINDDLDSISDVPRMLGRGAGLKLNLVFWTAFMANTANFFGSGNKNNQTGGSSALSSTSLGTAKKQFRNQTDADGNPLGVMPKVLLVPPSLEETAIELMRSANYVAGGGSSIGLTPSSNGWQGAYQVVCTPYLENGNITGNSTTAWFLLCDPMDIPVIETCFLDGNEIPTVEQADADFSTLGIEMRGYHDFGVAMQDYRGGQRSAGA